MSHEEDGEEPANPLAKKKELWQNSAAKALLRAAILSGEITDDMLPKDVFNLCPEEHGKWKYENWSASLARLRNSIARDRERMTRDVLSYANDLEIVQRGRDSSTTLVPWHRSAACALLKADVKAGLHNQMKPQALYLTRREYHEHFQLKEFRRHIYQEVDKESKRAVRFEKKKKAWLYPELHKEHPRLQQSHDSDNDE